jgi:hypothetical protein
MSSTPDVASLLERLRKIQALYDAPATDGERQAAAAAAARVEERLRAAASASPTSERAFGGEQPKVEFQLRIEDAWSRRLFIGIAQHHGVRPYRYRGQRRTSLVVRTTRRMLDGVIMPHYRDAVAVMSEHFDAIAEKVIREALQVAGDEAEVRVDSGGELPVLPEGTEGPEVLG